MKLHEILEREWLPDIHIAQFKTEEGLVKQILSQMKKGYYTYAMALCRATERAGRYTNEIKTIHNALKNDMKL